MSTHLICTKQHGRHDWTHNRTHNPQLRKNNLSQKKLQGKISRTRQKKNIWYACCGNWDPPACCFRETWDMFSDIVCIYDNHFLKWNPMSCKTRGWCWKIHRTWTTQPVEQHGYSCAFSSSRIQAGHESPHARCQNDYVRIIPHWQMGKDGEIHHALGKMQINGTHWNPKIFIIRDGAHR